MEPNKKRYSVFGVIRNEEGKILVQDHVKSNALNLPGGKIEPEELGNLTEEEITEKVALVALKRELNEELGITVNKAELLNTKPIPSGPLEYPVGTGKYIQTNFIYFDIKEYSGNIEIKEPDKCRELLYLTPEEVVNYKVKPSTVIKILIMLLNKWM